jgi:hypothetical protein
MTGVVRIVLQVLLVVVAVAAVIGIVSPGTGLAEKVVCVAIAALAVLGIPRARRLGPDVPG